MRRARDLTAQKLSNQRIGAPATNDGLKRIKTKIVYNGGDVLTVKDMGVSSWNDKADRSITSRAQSTRMSDN